MSIVALTTSFKSNTTARKYYTYIFHIDYRYATVVKRQSTKQLHMPLRWCSLQNATNVGFQKLYLKTSIRVMAELTANVIICHKQRFSFQSKQTNQQHINYLYFIQMEINNFVKGLCESMCPESEVQM